MIQLLIFGFTQAPNDYFQERFEKHKYIFSVMPQNYSFPSIS